MKVECPLSISQRKGRIHLSAMVATVESFLVAITTTALSQLVVIRACCGRHIHLPASQLDWIIQAAREHRKVVQKDDYAVESALSRSAATFTLQHADLSFVMAVSPEGQVNSSPTHHIAVQSPNLSYFDSCSMDAESCTEDGGSVGGSRHVCHP